MAHREPNDPRCKDCPRKRLSGKSRCKDCEKRHRAEQHAIQTERAEQGLCPTCGAKSERGKRYCKPHLKYYAARDRARKAASN